MSDETTSLPATILYGSMKIEVTAEEADRVQGLLPGADPLNEAGLRSARRQHDHAVDKTHVPAPAHKVIKVEDTMYNTHALWLSPGVTFAITRTDPEGKRPSPVSFMTN